MGTYTVPDAGGAAPGGPEQAQMAGQEFAAMDQQHMGQPQYQQQMGAYPPPQQQQPYGGQQMFDPNMGSSMYGQPAYSMQQMGQSVSGASADGAGAYH